MKNEFFTKLFITVILVVVFVPILDCAWRLDCALNESKNKTVATENREVENASETATVVAENQEAENAPESTTAPTETPSTKVFPLTCRYTTADEGGVIKDWHSINAYSSLAEAQKNPLWVDAPAEYDLNLMVDKKVTMFYEQNGLIQKIKPHNGIYALHSLSSDCSQFDYIVQITYKKDSYFLYVDTREELEVVDAEPSKSYFSVVSQDEYRTLSPIRPVKFYDTKAKAIENPISLQEGLVTLTFYHTTGKNDFTVKVASDVFTKPQKLKVHKTRGKLAVYSFKETYSEIGFDSSYSYLVTEKMSNGDSKYLQIVIE